MAYRKDVEQRKGPIGKDAGSWIAISTMVGQVALARGKDRRRILEDAASMAAGLFDAPALAYGCAFDPPRVDRSSSIARLRLLAERIEVAESLHLVAALLESLFGLLPDESLNAGRVLAQQARVATKMGNADLALARYRQLRHEARSLKDNELLVRSWAGFSAIAQVRGNYPKLRKWAELVVQQSDRCGYERLGSVGHHGLMIACAVAHDISSAINHGWKAYRSREGHRPGQVEILANLGQLFFEAGHHAAARSAFVQVLVSRPSARVAASALGGLALSSAVINDENAVKWAAAEIANLSDSRSVGYETAAALLDCAKALDSIGEFPYGSVLRARGSTMAQYSGYHELVYKEETAQKQRPALLTKPAEAIASEITGLRTVELPDHLELVTA